MEYYRIKCAHEVSISLSCLRVRQHDASMVDFFDSHPQISRKLQKGFVSIKATQSSSRDSSFNQTNHMTSKERMIGSKLHGVCLGFDNKT